MVWISAFVLIAAISDTQHQRKNGSQGRRYFNKNIVLFMPSICAA
jgi:hypothetical protein